MWLRQVQKDPDRFLAQKFYMQNLRKEKSVPLNNVDLNIGKDGKEKDSENENK
jgi:hypothetical protein